MVHPEPARRADDACRLVSEAASSAKDAVRWLPRAAGLRAGGGRRLLSAVALALLVGTAPDPAVAPSAAAHDRDGLDLRAAAALSAPEREAGLEAAPAAPRFPLATAWSDLPLPEEQPPTPQLIEAQLRALVAEAARGREAAAPAVADPDEVLRFGAMTVRRGIAETILRAAAATGVDPVYMMALADKESSFGPQAKASTSSAEGLFQFLARSWLYAMREFGPRHGLAAEAALIEVRDGEPSIPDEEARGRVLNLRRDPYVAGLMAGEVLKRDRARIERRLGRELKVSELYFAHFLGQAGAGRLMELAEDKPSALATRAFRAAAKANRSLFTERQGRKRRSLTVAEVYGRIDRMIDGRLDRYAQVVEVVRPN